MSEEERNHKRGKNIKNIYVHKITSLMRISRDNLHDQEIQSLMKGEKNKKFKRIHSEVDKNTLKLEKNRQSARKARQRKKLYIKLLENQVQKLRQTALKGDKLEKQANHYLQNLNKRMEDSMLDSDYITVDKYLSQSQLQPYKDTNQFQLKERLTNMDKYTQEICQMYVPYFLKNLQETRQFTNEQIKTILLQSQTSLKQMDTVKGLMQDILTQNQNMRKKFEKLVRINENAKKILKNTYEEVKNETFEEQFEFGDEKVHTNTQEQLINLLTRTKICALKGNMQQVFHSIHTRRTTPQIFMNAIQTENILGKMDKYISDASINEQ